MTTGHRVDVVQFFAELGDDLGRRRFTWNGALAAPATAGVDGDNDGFKVFRQEWGRIHASNELLH
jgi:hypothetical protein